MPATFTVGATSVSMQVEFSDEPQMLIPLPGAGQQYRTILHAPNTNGFIYQKGGLGARTMRFKCQISGSGILNTLLGLLQQAGTLVIVRHSGGTTTYANAILDDLGGMPTEYEMLSTETVEVEPVFLVSP